MHRAASGGGYRVRITVWPTRCTEGDRAATCCDRQHKGARGGAAAIRSGDADIIGAGRRDGAHKKSGAGVNCDTRRQARGAPCCAGEVLPRGVSSPGARHASVTAAAATHGDDRRGAGAGVGGGAVLAISAAAKTWYYTIHGYVRRIVIVVLLPLEQ